MCMYTLFENVILIVTHINNMIYNFNLPPYPVKISRSAIEM